MSATLASLVLKLELNLYTNSTWTAFQTRSYFCTCLFMLELYIQDVCVGLRSIIDTIAIEDLQMVVKVLEQLLLELTENGLTHWESDLAKVTLICDCVRIIAKSIQTERFVL